MSAFKFLVSGLSNSGKTRLTSTLEDALVVYHDGKRYPYKVSHVNANEFSTSDQLITIITDKMEVYNEKFGHYPSTVVLDTVSKIFDTLMDSCNTRFKNFDIYKELDKEIHIFTDFIEHTLIANGINVILISHALWKDEDSQYQLVGKGSFQKRGGFLAEVDQASFIEVRNGKRFMHHRSTKFPARTTLSELPDSQPLDDYDFNAHIQLLTNLSVDAQDYEL